jgi:hypothetical protein
LNGQLGGEVLICSDENKTLNTFEVTAMFYNRGWVITPDAFSGEGGLKRSISFLFQDLMTDLTVLVYTPKHILCQDAPPVPFRQYTMSQNNKKKLDCNYKDSFHYTMDITDMYSLNQSTSNVPDAAKLLFNRLNATEDDQYEAAGTIMVIFSRNGLPTLDAANALVSA